MRPTKEQLENIRFNLSNYINPCRLDASRLLSEIDALTKDLEAMTKERDELFVAGNRWRESAGKRDKEVTGLQAKLDIAVPALEGLTNAALADIKPLPGQIEAGFEALAKIRGA